MKKSRSASVAIILCLFLLPPSFSQISFLNNGIPIVNTDVSFLVDGNMVHQNNGSISNVGNFYITGNWVNNNITGNVFTTGTDGWLHLNGNTQNIEGTTLTHFNNLELSGNGTKQLNTVDTEVEDTLKLNDREFAAGDNTIFVISSNAGIVTQTTGFVSSTNNGGLSRNTSSTDTYFFPVGSSAGTLRFRPVDIIPNDTTASTFKVRMANIDATQEGFDRSLKENTIGAINSNFYHKINRTNGISPADVTLYYNTITDGEFDIISQWQSISGWKNLGTVTDANNYNMNSITKMGVDDFSSVPFVMAEVVPNVVLANVFSPNNDGKNDVLHVLAKGVEQLEFIIFDRWGEKVFETNDITVGWDGTFRGKPMNVGVFVYVIKGKFKNGEVIDKKGNVTLMK